MIRKALVIGIILWFVGTYIIPSNALDTLKPIPASRDKWLYVGGSGPGNYTRIQDAIDNASDGDTVFVFNGTYFEYNIIIDKSINLIGEDKNNTIIDGNDNISDVLWLVEDGIYVSGFTITHGGWDGVFLDPSSNSTIIRNKIISNGGDGIDTNYSLSSNDNTIQNNIIDSNNNYGIYFRDSSKHNIISNNLINNSLYGVSLDRDCYDNIIAGNSIANTSRGIELNSQLTKVENNNISNCDQGIEIHSCSENTISKNIFENNRFGVFFSGFPYNNTIVNNSFNNDGFFILGETSGNIVQNNTINDKPLVYLENESDMIIQEDAGQIFLIYCRNITIADEKLSNASIAIQLIISDDCHIIGNTLTNNFFGLWIESSFNTTISENNISNNLYNGMTLSSCFYSSVTGNTITGNNNYTIYPWGYLFQEFFGHNSSAGILLLTSVNNTISENIISWNIANGITCILSAKNTISRNHLELNNDTGLLLIGSAFNKVYQNSFLDNKNDAFFHTCFLNKWKGNYWSEPRKLPKLIEGKIGRHLNWYNIDWRPAQEPYDI